MQVSRRRSSIFASAVLLAALLAAPAIGQKSHVPTSEWWPEVEEVDQALRKHHWKSGLKKAKSLIGRVTTRSWYGRDLRQIVADLAFYQAVAEANLDRKREALWHWHAAQNLDFRMRYRDLEPYGSAAKLLREFFLREQGEAAAGFDLRRPVPGEKYERPVKPKTAADPRILNNTGAALEGSGDCQLELVLDEKGEFHHPVVFSPHLHPIIIYAVLAKLPQLPAWEPARIDGEPVATLFNLTMRFHVSRW